MLRLRSAELEMPNAAAAAAFFASPWNLIDAGKRGNTHFLRGTAEHGYIISTTEAPEKAIASVTFSGTRDEVAKMFAAAQANHFAHTAMRDYDEPGKPHGFNMTGPEGQVYRFITETDPVKALPADRNRPIQLTHAVMNVLDRPGCVEFARKTFGFTLSDRTRTMSFLRCNNQHHAVAYADSKHSSLNHLAFEMVDLDAVMLGYGRMKDNKVPLMWGPGRHGPGNNVFSYFVPPHGGVIEYTSEINLVDDSYREGKPEDWTWPPGRIDHWGVDLPNKEVAAKAESEYKFRKMQ